MSDAAPTWEQIVEWVTCSSNHLAVSFAAERWEEALRHSTQTGQWIQELSRRNAQSWKGPGAEAFRAHLRELATSLEADADQQRRTVAGLKRCAAALATAVRGIPVPSWQFDEVRQRQLDFALNGVPASIAPHAFWQTLIGPNPQGWTAPALQAAEEFFRGAEAQARQAYQRLCQEYREAARQMPDGTRVPVPGVTKKAGGGTGTAGPTRSATPATTPATNPLATQMPTPSTTPPSTNLPPMETPSLTPLDPPDLPGFTPSKPGAFDPPGGLDDDLGTSLAGAGGGFGGLGGGTGGLGAGLGSVATLGSPGMGPAATPPAGVLAARTAAGAPGATGFGMPVAPMAGAGGLGAGGTGGTGRTVEIHEDEAIFHPRQAPSGVIDV